MSRKLAGIALLVTVGLIVYLLMQSPSPQLATGEDINYGYTPNPEYTEGFLRSLDKPTLREAGPELFMMQGYGDDKPVLLYRALYEAYKAKTGKDWVVGRQGIGDCFVENTQVLMSDGTEKNIQDVKIGELIRTPAGNIKPVVDLIDKSYSGELIKLTGNRTITATPDHKFITGDGWRSAWELSSGDILFSSGSYFKKTEITVDSIRVYCLTIPEEHAFIANGYGVSNCVSWATAHAADIHLAVMWKLGDASDWKQAATEAIYGGSRVEAQGKTFGGWSDGSWGSAAAKWSKGWGIVFREPYPTVDLSIYSADRAKQWGAYGCGGRDDNGKLDNEAKKHPIKNVALVTTFEEAVAAIKSGYPISICSGQGFSNVRDKDGFLRAQGRWSHAMAAVGVRFDRPGLLILNSWGTNWVSGPKWPEDQPDGSFWVDANVINGMLRGRDSFAYSGYEGFPKKDLNHDTWAALPSQNNFLLSHVSYLLGL